MLWAGQSGVQILAVVRDFSHPQNVLTTAGPHGQKGALSPRVKQVGCEADRSPPCTAKVNLLVLELNARCDVQHTRIYMGLRKKRHDRLLAVPVIGILSITLCGGYTWHLALNCWVNGATSPLPLHAFMTCMENFTFFSMNSSCKWTCNILTFLPAYSHFFFLKNYLSILVAITQKHCCYNAIKHVLFSYKN